jgi:heat shock protein HtpX
VAAGADGSVIPTKDLRELRAMSSMRIAALPAAAAETGTGWFSRLLDRMMAPHPPLATRLELLAALSRELGSTP